MIRSPAILEHEPPMLLGFSWSELTTIFVPTTVLWLLLTLLVSMIYPGEIQEKLMLGIVVYLFGESTTLILLAYWYGKVRKNKYEGWHLHMLATRFHFLGFFKNVCYDGKWRC